LKITRDEHQRTSQEVIPSMISGNADAKQGIPSPTMVYHITHLRNLPSILAAGGLLACGTLRKAGLGYTDIAHQHIQDRRSSKLVPCGPGGVLHDYVPFYFAPRSPMLFAIHRNNVVGYDDGQEPVVHLVSAAQHIEKLGLRFVFSDGHGTMFYTDFFDSLDALDRVDWPVMRATFWADTYDDNDRKRRRQAEFLVHQIMPWSGVLSIGVMSATVRTQVQAMLAGATHRPAVIIRRDWYY